MDGESKLDQMSGLGSLPGSECSEAELAEVRRRLEKRERHLDKYQGCLLGGAAGDALGYAVEFMSYDAIVGRYGEGGIREYDRHFFGGDAQFSDDTQMTLFTAAGILHGSTRMHLRGIAGKPSAYVHRSYLDWLATQDPGFSDAPGDTWLSAVPGLRRRMAPGNTCLAALRGGVAGSPEQPVNDSKGCGGVMRVAPVGLFFGRDAEYCVECGAEVAALTHGHPLGYISAGALAYIVARCAFGVSTGREDPRRELAEIVGECCEGLPGWFPEHPSAARYQAELLQAAMGLSERGPRGCADIRELGGGWVGEEALAIAVYAGMCHADDFSAAIRLAVNHDGDSDSTGSICGNIVGALLGMSGIGQKWAEGLDMADLVLDVAKDLCDDCPMEGGGSYWDDVWFAKYGGAPRVS